jgi:hypothetical protein
MNQNQPESPTLNVILARTYGKPLDSDPAEKEGPKT